MAIIYRHWFPCTVTAENPRGKGYVGYTYKTLEERDRIRFRPSAVKDSAGLKRAIAKYGKENMQTDIVESDILSIHDLVIEREIYWIAYFDDFHNGYNMAEGGKGGKIWVGEHPMLGKKNPQVSGKRMGILARGICEQDKRIRCLVKDI